MVNERSAEHVAVELAGTDLGDAVRAGERVGELERPRRAAGMPVQLAERSVAQVDGPGHDLGGPRRRWQRGEQVDGFEGPAGGDRTLRGREDIGRGLGTRHGDTIPRGGSRRSGRLVRRRSRSRRRTRSRPTLPPSRAAVHRSARVPRAASRRRRSGDRPPRDPAGHASGCWRTSAVRSPGTGAASTVRRRPRSTARPPHRSAARAHSTWRWNADPLVAGMSGSLMSGKSRTSAREPGRVTRAATHGAGSGFS